MRNTTDKIKERITDTASAVQGAAAKVKDTAVRAVDKSKATAVRAAKKVKATTDRAVEKVKDA
jgi:hypothetical protein